MPPAYSRASQQTSHDPRERALRAASPPARRRAVGVKWGAAPASPHTSTRSDRDPAMACTPAEFADDCFRLLAMATTSRVGDPVAPHGQFPTIRRFHWTHGSDATTKSRTGSARRASSSQHETSSSSRVDSAECEHERALDRAAVTPRAHATSRMGLSRPQRAVRGLCQLRACFAVQWAWHWPHSTIPPAGCGSP